MADTEFTTEYKYWCDGSCFHTSKREADRTMGIGVYYRETNELFPTPVHRRLAISAPPGNHNEAEYLAIICALYDLYIMVGTARSGVEPYVIEKTHAVIHSDSQLVIRQITKVYATKKKHLAMLGEQVQILLTMVNNLGVDVEFKWNPRTADNQQIADWLSKVGNPYFINITADDTVNHQVEGPTPIEDILFPVVYQTIKKNLRW